MILIMRLRLILTILLTFSCTIPLLSKDSLPSLLRDLDKVITEVESIDRQKKDRIDTLRETLGQCISSEERHDTYFQLFKEYEPYIFDSALYYVQAHLDISIKENNTAWINECKMQLARMLSTFARFDEAISLLNSINKAELPESQLGAYYNSYAEVYVYWSEYASNDQKLDYISLRDTYQDSALNILTVGTYDFDINNGRQQIDLGNFHLAEQTLIPYLSEIDPDTRDYAILTSIIAYLYEKKDDKELQKVYLAKSAIADIKASVKENTSLSLLANLLFKENEMERANSYIKKSLEDANFYNARLRTVQILQILPIIDKAYQVERESHQKNLQLLIVVIGILSIFLVALVVYLFRQMNKLGRTRKEVIKANKELKQVNSYLTETNHIKEEYIGRFLSQCSAYIDKLEAYRKALNKKASAGKMEELFSMLKSHQIIEDELKEFYQNFDTTFLNLFPNFVTEFNALLPEEDRLLPKQEGSLNVELRIFALIRLGITDSSKIANFLRYSITTIYNYRSKYRNKSLIARDKFEDTIMKIGSFQRPDER